MLSSKTEQQGHPRVRKRLYTRLMDLYRYYPVYIPGFNPLVRTIQSWKSRSDQRRLVRHTSGMADEIEAWYRGRRFFFAFGLYRSGTTFLADLLNRHAKGALVQHEANINDYREYTIVLQNPALAEPYIREYRLNDLYWRMRHRSFGVYGEISPYLRLHGAAIRSCLPDARLFQVVRHPAGVIRSLMSREQLGWKDPMGRVTRPAPDDPWADAWKGWGRFEKFCWMWAHDNRIMRNTCGHFVRFEEMREDYGYFRERVLDHLGLSMDEAAFARYAAAPYRNATPRHTFREYDLWTAAEKQFFHDMCGEEMACYGY